MTKSEKEMTSKGETKLCKKAHKWPSLETLKNLVKNEGRCLALPPKEIQELEENDKLDKEPPKTIVQHSNSHSTSTTVSDVGNRKNNGNHQLQVQLWDPKKGIAKNLCIDE